ncbi:unnamed protein product [Dovyalis caffra]|uniref:Apyrase n=1 Tax=Dovyalis caffra TaxID=77055 RepID=A0AAV1RWP7_9ROSI|nr:unnamed protein product [Dovyalis caffra]
MPTSAHYKFTNRKIFLPSRSKVSGSDSTSYAVIFDAGSSGSRVHVFRFDQHLVLLPVGNGTDFELYVQVKPGLSSYADDPEAAADSLVPLLKEAENVVPEELRSKTPVRVGATAGLRSLEGDASELILEAVRDLIANSSSLKYEADAVSILTGSQEGSYMWIAINYLLENLGNKYPDTVGVVDLGGGSIQMAYTISEENAAIAPTVADGEDPYVEELLLKGTKYYLYVHSYLNYGLLAARAGILKVSKNSSNPCILAGYDGIYSYGGVDYKASASPSGTSFTKCRRAILKVLRVNAPCEFVNCTFGGIWNGGGGEGQKNLYVASFFFDMAAAAGFVDTDANSAEASPSDFKKAAELACETKFEDVKSKYPNAEEEDLPYLCMDLSYEYTLLVDGFGLHPRKRLTLVKQIEYQNSLIGAAWPLGSAIEADIRTKSILHEGPLDNGIYTMLFESDSSLSSA